MVAVCNATSCQLPLSDISKAEIFWGLSADQRAASSPLIRPNECLTCAGLLGGLGLYAFFMSAFIKKNPLPSATIRDARWFVHI